MRTRQLISSGSPFEELAKYSRAVVDGEWIFVSGTVGADPETGEIPEDVKAQARTIFRIIESALREANASLADVLHARVYIVSQEYLEEVAEVLSEAFRNIRPANTTLISALPVPGAKVEIEVTARRRTT